MPMTGTVTGGTPIVSIVNRKSEAARANLLKQQDQIAQATQRGARAAAALLEAGVGSNIDLFA